MKDTTVMNCPFCNPANAPGYKFKEGDQGIPLCSHCQDGFGFVIYLVAPAAVSGAYSDLPTVEYEQLVQQRGWTSNTLLGPFRLNTADPTPKSSTI